MTGPGSKLRGTLGIAAPDDFYAALLAAHEGLTAEASARLNARLILLLANQVGDREVLDEILAAAQRAGAS